MDPTVVVLYITRAYNTLSFLLGLFTASDVESMLAEITKMKDLHHPNVMSLIGVCLDAGPGVSIVMPFMANGSLLDYLKKERDKIYLPDTSELEDVSQYYFKLAYSKLDDTIHDGYY